MGVLAALRFLTALPLPEAEVDPKRLGRSAVYFPAVGVLLGLLLALEDALLGLVWPPLLRSTAVVVTLILLTGGLHLDGLMDSCDGLFGRRDPEQRLAIMRDSRAGSFGVLGAVSIVLLKVAALATVGAWLRPAGLVMAPVLGRAAMVLAIWRFPYARPQGLGRAFKDGVGGWQVAGALGLAAVTLAAAPLPVSLAACGAAAAVALLGGAFICTRIPGLTGDSYGAINEVAELAVLLVFATMAGG